MSLPTYDDESWLRSELHGLLVDEPAMTPAAVTDDVRRGQARLRTVRRRRTAAIAVAALLVAVAIPVGLLVRPGAQSQVGPSSGSDVPDVPGVSSQWLESISPALAAQVGWVVDWPDSTVYGDVASGLQLDLTIVPGQQVASDPPRFAVPSGPYPQTASLRLWFAPTGKAPGAALAECPADRCPRDLPDRRFPTYLDQSATAGNGTSLAAGTLIVDRSYDSGRFVELVSVPASMTPSSPSDQISQNVLSYGLAAPFLDAIGAPVAAPLQDQPGSVATEQLPGLLSALIAAPALVRSATLSTIPARGCLTPFSDQALCGTPAVGVVLDVVDGAYETPIGVVESVEAPSVVDSSRCQPDPRSGDVHPTAGYQCVDRLAWTQVGTTWSTTQRVGDAAGGCREEAVLRRGAVSVVVREPLPSAWCDSSGAANEAVPLTDAQLQTLAASAPLARSLFASPTGGASASP